MMNLHGDYDQFFNVLRQTHPDLTKINYEVA